MLSMEAPTKRFAVSPGQVGQMPKPPAAPLATTPYAGAPATDPRSLTSGALTAGAQSGAFDPFGSPVLRASLRARALRAADAQRRRGSVLSRLLGLNPNEAASAALETDRQAGSDASNAITSADYGLMSGQQDWLRSLLSGQMGALNAQDLARLQAILAQQANDRNRPGVGGMLGDLAGRAVTGYLTRKP